MANKKQVVVEVFVFSERKDPQNIKIEGETIQEIVLNFNKIRPNNLVIFHTSTDPEFRINKISKLNIEKEIEFHNKPSFCIIDGKIFSKYKEEFLSVRAHHFPCDLDLEKFSIVNPIESSKEESGEECDESTAISTFEKDIFRCRITPPTKKDFIGAFRLLTFHYKSYHSAIINYMHGN